MEIEQAREWRGSVCTGILTSRWPFGKMIACLDHKELRSLMGSFILPRNEVERIERAGSFPWLWIGIRIWHAHDGYPDRLMFNPILPWRRSRILEDFKSLGYKVA
ncbi:MAG: hypothetical protein ACYSWW_06260 [Planctomycetota bacterium]|jgi:hypothetical protein